LLEVELEVELVVELELAPVLELGVDADGPPAAVPPVGAELASIDFCITSLIISSSDMVDIIRAISSSESCTGCCTLLRQNQH
jgi:hypothetical protein